MDVLGAMWDDATTDFVTEQRAFRLSAAKVDAASFWPFLAGATSGHDFDNRLSLVAADLTAAVPADLLNDVVASLREDYLSVQAAGSPDDWRAQQRKPRPEPWEEDDDHAKGDEAADRAWERRHESARRTARGFDPDYDDPEEDDRRSPRRRYLDPDNEYDPADEKFEHRHGAHDDWSAPDMWVGVGGRVATHQQHLGGAYSTDDWGQRQREMYPERYDPSGDHADGKYSPDDNNMINGADYDAIQQHLPPGSPYRKNHRPTASYFHAGLGRWVAAAEDGPGNPRYPDQTPEWGPNTGESGYQNYAPDPPNRTLDQFDHAMPGAWADRTPWFEQGNAATGQYVARQHAATGGPQDFGYWHDGRENEGYFDQGSEGITGPGTDGAPPPIQGNPAAGVASGGPEGNTTSEPIGNRMDWYQNMGPSQTTQSGMGPAQGSRHPFVGDSRPWVPPSGYESGYGQDEEPLTVDDSRRPSKRYPQVGWQRSDGAHVVDFDPSAHAYGDLSSRTSAFFDPHDASVHSLGTGLGMESPMGMTPPGMGDQVSDAAPEADGDSNTPQGGTASGGGEPAGMPDALLTARRRSAAGAPGGAPGGASSGSARSSGGSSGGTPPPAPAQTQPGGPGSVAAPPMEGGMSSSNQVPQSTKPRQMPGSGGAGGAGGASQIPQLGVGGAPGMPGGAAGGGAAPGIPTTGRWVQGAGFSRDIETPDNPSGVGDEFMGNTFEQQMRQRPRQDDASRGVNTPQNPGAREHIPTLDTSGPGTPGSGEDERREASLIAARAARDVLAGVR